MNPLSYFYSIRSYVDSYAGILGRRFLTLIWAVALCVVIWLYGYLIGYGTFKPLQSVTARLIAIAVILLVWAIYMVVSTLRARKQDKELVQSIEQEALANQAAEVGEIHTRLKEALALLRRVTRKRFGYIYDLPWYVIFGAPGSGKTTALANSGLKFPLGEALGSNGVKGVGGTRNCNWWFAEEAILIDTAGRYTTQDDIGGAAKAGWEGFLGLLRRYRRSQPINGALVTLSVGDLMSRDPEAQREELRAIRQRLSELDEFLGARVPVYVILTKADLLPGFVEFFDGFSKTDREQVWGTTFKLDESYKAEDLPGRFEEEFALLQQRVNSMLLERLQQEQDAELRGRIFRFPAELSRLREMLTESLSELSAGSQLLEAPLIRGVYFASGTQVDAFVPEATAGRQRRSYFLTRLFREVIFNEAALVSRDRRLSSRQMLLRRLAYGTGVTVLALIFASWVVTYVQNNRALAAAEQHIDAYENLAQDIRVRDVSDSDFLRILPALDNLQAVNTDFDRKGILNVGFGLDQRDKIASRQMVAYHKALDSLLLPRMIVQLQKDMKATNDVTRTFNALKLYGMLGGLGPVDRDFVGYQARTMFERLYPGAGREVARAELTAHAEALASQSTLPAVDLDPYLLDKARKTIADESVANRAFDILAGSGRAADLPGWNGSAAFGPLGEKVFERISGAPLQQGLSGIFTANGYRDVVLPDIMQASRTALSEEWVRGSDDRLIGQTVDQVASAALDIYFDRFEKSWAGLLSDIRVKPSNSITDAAETTRILSNDRNVVGLAARSIAEATDLRLSATGDLASLGDAATSDTVTTLLASTVTAPDPYGKLRAALEAPTGATAAPSTSDGDEEADANASQVDALLPKLGKLHDQLSRASTSAAEIVKIFDVDSQLTEANEDLLQAARTLPGPLDIWIAGVSADIGSLAVKSARAGINSQWTADGASLCESIVPGRYPFDRQSTRDVAMSDFVRLFGPEGVFRSFFDSHLAPFVDKTQSPWRWKGAFGAKGEQSAALAQFENADKITRAFFPNGSTDPSVSINIKPVSLSDRSNAVMLEIEGERVVYFHGPIQAKSINWPAQSPVNLSRIAFQPGGWQKADTESGDWSPFRLFDNATITRKGQDLFRATFDGGGQKAEFDVQFGTVLNPFQLPAMANFACPANF
ncbi:type VI secretion system membrane subunit TssM [Rhizobium halophytocola]|uniref:Type VI secretion system protein ImpL n=1 Tax=Rhizobium halophytocola TaxID=735519 RepID=A0ABS4E681_9HYPH|nr:type VI secretion system protein ImpL [Rhizobium halophytocola]